MPTVRVIGAALLMVLAVLFALGGLGYLATLLNIVGYRDNDELFYVLGCVVGLGLACVSLAGAVKLLNPRA